MSEVFRIHIISSTFRTCFFYLNSDEFKKYENSSNSIKIQYGETYEKEIYGSISLTGLSEVPHQYIGLTSLFADRLGLHKDESVLVSRCQADSISSLEISPLKLEDYTILISCKSIIETHLLNQVSVVTESQILPLYVFSNIAIDVEIGKLNSNANYGQLQKFTEIKVLDPAIKKKQQTNSYSLSTNNIKNNRKNLKHILDELNSIINCNNNENELEKQRQGELIIKHLLDDSVKQNCIYKVKPYFLFPYELPKTIQNKFIIVSNFKHSGNVDGDHCVKILAKIQKEKLNEKDSDGIEEDNKDSYFYSYVISLNWSYDNIIYCPKPLMKRLKLFAGSFVGVEKIIPNPRIEIQKWPEQIEFEDENTFWDSISKIRKSMYQTVINNFKYNYNINSLVLGGQGCGKTFLLSDIVNDLTEKYIFCKVLQCKSLRGKKIDTLHQLWNDTLKECSLYDPAVLVLDDLHVLTYIDESEEKINRLYSERIVDLISNAIEDFQSYNNITVIASARNMTQLASLVSQHGPRLFQNVLTIPEMNLSERKFCLKNIIRGATGVFNDTLINLDLVSSSTNGYTIQDISDLVKRAVFNSFLRNDSEDVMSDVEQVDFESALSELMPLNLRNVKLKQTLETKWESVGGMLEPKKILIEVFSWPLKYPALLESCPLRLQRGVLLYGAPGTGKTLLAGAIANKCGLNFISVKGPEVLSKYVGASEEGVRNLFLQAQKTQPCLLFFDEFDSLAPKRGHDNTGVTDRVVNQLLTQLDGVETISGVWVLAATSRPDLLDPALLRPGRLDKMVFCDIPDQTDRLQILEALSQNLPKADDVNLSEVAEVSEGYTGADLQGILYSAQMSAVKEAKNSLNEKPKLNVKQCHLINAFSDVKPSLSRKEKEKYKIIYEKFLNSRKGNSQDSFEGIQRITFA